MSIISGEALQDPQSKKWGWLVVHAKDGPVGDSGYIFDTKEEAETELVKTLQDLNKISKDY